MPNVKLYGFLELCLYGIRYMLRKLISTLA
jgi:hypothetical protein